jgi:hypothetical protein
MEWLRDGQPAGDELSDGLLVLGRHAKPGMVQVESAS